MSAAADRTVAGEGAELLEADPFGLPEFPYRHHHLSDRCAAFVNPDGLSSVGVIDAGDGLVLVDATIHPYYVTRIVEELRSIYGRPVLYLVNTHFHADHTVGNHYVRTEHGLVAHRMCADYQRRFLPAMLGERGRPYESVRMRTPDVTFEGDHHVLDGCSVDVEIHRTGGHTHDSCLVHVPADGVVFSGDSVFNRVPPYVAHWSCLDHFGRVSEWIESLSAIERLGPRVIVPGHGEIATSADVDGLRRFFEYYVEVVTDGVARGARLKEIWSTIMARADFRRRELEADVYLHMTMALYDELTGDGSLYEK